MVECSICLDNNPRGVVCCGQFICNGCNYNKCVICKKDFKSNYSKNCELDMRLLFKTDRVFAEELVRLKQEYQAKIEEENNRIKINKPSSEHEIVVEKNGNEIIKYCAIDGKKDGPYEVWKSGKLLVSTFYKNGEKDGVYKEYFSNITRYHKLKILCFYKNGKYNGVYQRYNIDCQLIFKCHYIDGKKDGECIEYQRYNSNKKKIHCFYKNDKLIKEYKSWYINGLRNVFCHYENGKYHGLYRSWDHKGNLTNYITYSNGEIINEKSGFSFMCKYIYDQLTKKNIDE